MPSTPLSDLRLHVKLKLSALWTSLMFCFVYGDYFELYRPGKLDSVMAGRIGPWEVSQTALLGTSVLMAVPSLMVALSLLLPAALSRAANLLAAAFYALVMALVIRGTWQFYVFFGLVEIALCVAIIVLAWRWPREESAS
jgi:hypothetical protein